MTKDPPSSKHFASLLFGRRRRQRLEKQRKSLPMLQRHFSQIKTALSLEVLRKLNPQIVHKELQLNLVADQLHQDLMERATVIAESAGQQKIGSFIAKMVEAIATDLKQSEPSEDKG